MQVGYRRCRGTKLHELRYYKECMYYNRYLVSSSLLPLHLYHPVCTLDCYCNRLFFVKVCVIPLCIAIGLSHVDSGLYKECL